MSPGAPKGRARRRSARVQLHIPVSLALRDSDEPLSAETVTVSKHGARVRLGLHARSLKRGDTLCVTIADRHKSRVARIVWVDERGNGHCGIEFGDPGNFWGIHFPGTGEKNALQEERAALQSVKDFEAAQAARKRKSPGPPLPAVAAASSPQPSAPQRGKARAGDPALPLVAAIAPAPNAPVLHLSASEPALGTPPFDAEAGMQAVITGLSAVRTSFSERILLTSTDGKQATALLTRVIEPGVTLRILTGDQRVLTAKVMSVGDKREGDKWRIWLKLLSSKPLR